MKKADFKIMLSKVATKMLDLTASKGEEYSRDDDQFANFKRQAEDAGVSKYVVWMIFFNKHIDAVKYFVKHGSTKSESIIDRVDDAILYLILLRGMLIEDGHNSAAIPPLVVVDPHLIDLDAMGAVKLQHGGVSFAPDLNCEHRDAVDRRANTNPNGRRLRHSEGYNFSINRRTGFIRRKPDAEKG